MSEKRRGLGRGLGALIPTGLDGQRPSGGERPADVFFGDAKRDNGEPTAPAAAATATLTEAAPAVPVTVPDSPEVAGVVPASASNGTPVGSVAETDVRRVETVAAEATPADVTSADGLVPVPGARFAELPVGEIRPNPKQPRTVFDEDALEELVGSIREVGVLQPIVVRDAGDGYELIMGERRWRATQAAGLATIPAIIRDTDDSDLLRDALLENLHRSELNPLEEAAAYQQLLDDFGCTHEQLATRIQRSRPQISNTLRLLKLPPLVQRRVAAGVLSAGHARALLGLSDGAAIERLAQRIVAEGLSVRAVEEIVSLGGDAEPAARRAAPRAGVKNEALDHLAARLSDRFETRVKVSLGKSRGRLTVEFASVQDLNRILASLAPEDPGLLKG
ncbi:chromosome partitioning protein ParB [Cellulomonas sp. Root485]|uniref:ParB/RepB/Spo0J family partition protein n=1 Tax=Cellulomonas sp. Root485 TaxID=1736546 RepID=UPI0006FC010B|nr:ParB/RepB/Spo0J family partition protein [Cellulomonas sp. Root485]KQY22752.1 chromosome partitioning protein ParB [Cellulomonas sp. Root485]